MKNMTRSGYADLPLHYGKVPPWLYERMGALGSAIVECIVASSGKKEVLRRLSDPFWFQALGCVLGMDWHSSGITTSVLGALKRSLNPKARELGIYFCGGKGKHSRSTPDELLAYSEKTGLPGDELVRCSKLSARVDNNAIQDGFQIYLHSFVVSDEGDWTVVQQGLSDAKGMARRYHWHSANIQSFVEEPHTAVVGEYQGRILNLIHRRAAGTRESLIDIVHHPPGKILSEARSITFPSHHEVLSKDVNLKRLGAVLALAYEHSVQDFSTLLLTKGLGPRTLQSLTLVSEVMYGTPSRFDDPARFSFAHGGKDGHPFPVPTRVYDQTIESLKDALSKAKIGYYEKTRAFKRLAQSVMRIEREHDPQVNYSRYIAKEKRESDFYGGKTVFNE